MGRPLEILEKGLLFLITEIRDQMCETFQWWLIQRGGVL